MMDRTTWVAGGWILAGVIVGMIATWLTGEVYWIALGIIVGGAMSVTGYQRA